MKVSAAPVTGSEGAAAASWWSLASSGPVVRRACGYALVVGSILIAINHGAALLAGRLDRVRLAQMALTVTVPYVVSTLSSVGALRQRRGADER